MVKFAPISYAANCNILWEIEEQKQEQNIYQLKLVHTLSRDTELLYLSHK
jgi:hypothetical protein